MLRMPAKRSEQGFEGQWIDRTAWVLIISPEQPTYGPNGCPELCGL